MNAFISVDEKELKLNRFIDELAANLIDALARSLKHSHGSVVEFRLKGEEVFMFVDGREIPLDLGQARKIVGSVLRGFLLCLHGTDHAKQVHLRLER